jgi:hypothetical protein
MPTGGSVSTIGDVVVVFVVGVVVLGAVGVVVVVLGAVRVVVVVVVGCCVGFDVDNGGFIVTILEATVVFVVVVVVRRDEFVGSVNVDLSLAQTTHCTAAHCF